MTAQIHLRTNFSYKSLEDDLFELPPTVHTVAGLLKHMGDEIQFAFLDAHTGHLRPDIEVTLNNKDIWFYPKGLQHAFIDNDTFRNAVITYLDGVSNVYGYKILSYDEDSQWAKCLIYLHVTDHIEERYFFVYNDGGATHEEITVTV